MNEEAIALVGPQRDKKKLGSVVDPEFKFHIDV